MLYDVQKLPKVNKDLAEKLLEEEQRTDNKKRQKVRLLLFLSNHLHEITTKLQIIAELCDQGKGKARRI